MKLSARSEYACLAVAELSRQYGQGWMKIADIVDRKKIPRKFLEQILLNLKRAGYLQSRRGERGGYRLARPPDRISVAEIVRLIDGPLAPVDSVSKYFFAHTPIERDRALWHLFKEIRDVVAAKMESTTFGALVRK